MVGGSNRPRSGGAGRSRYFFKRKTSFQPVKLGAVPGDSHKGHSAAGNSALVAAPPQDAEDLQDAEQRPPPKKRRPAEGAEPVARKLTPLEEQVVALKEKHPNVLLMVECGYRFRFFGDDAETASKVLGIGAHEDTTGSGHFKATASVPVALSGGADNYIRKLVASGLKVGMVTQTETAAERKAGDGGGHSAVFQRQLTAVYTATTMMGEDVRLANNEGRPEMVLAIKEAGRNRLAMAGIQPMSGGVVFEVFEDDKVRSQLDQRLASLEPREIIMPGQGDSSAAPAAAASSMLSDETRATVYRYLRERSVGGQPGRLEEFSPEVFSAVDPAFVEALLDADSKLAKAWPDVPKPVADCLSALFKYLKEFGMENTLLTSDDLRRFSETSKRLQLPAMTVRNMDLFRADSSSSPQGTLFGLMCHATTKFGRRLFRHWFANPLTDRAEIERRLDVVEHLVANPAEFKAVSDLLKPLASYDLEVLLVAALNGKVKSRDFYHLCSSMETFRSQLLKLLSSDRSDSEPSLEVCLEKVVGCLEKVPGLLKMLKDVEGSRSQPEKKFDTFKSWRHFPKVVAILEEVELLETSLEKHKKSICKAVGWTQNFEYSQVSGLDYLVEVKSKDSNLVPDDWTKVCATKQVVRFRTPFICETLPKLQYAKERLESECARSWLRFLRDEASTFTTFMVGVRSLAKLDCLMSMATVSRNEGYCRPVFNASGNVEILDGRNPIVEASVKARGGASNQYVANDVSFSKVGVRGLVLTGPNMGGKSCYLRQIATAVLMAQLGCFVPATKACLPVFDSIFLRLGARDDMWTGRSTLMVELDEAALVLNSATENSLVLLDELGRGTCTFDGASIAGAVLNHLVTKVRCIFVFVTHFKSLCSDLLNYPAGSVSNGHMAFETDDDKDEAPDSNVLFLYKLSPGPCRNSFGINVGKMAGLPQVVLEEAAQVADSFEATDLLFKDLCRILKEGSCEM